MRSVLIGPTVLAGYAHIGWDTCAALLGPLASLAVLVLLNTSCKVSDLRRWVSFKVLVGYLKSTWSVSLGLVPRNRIVNESKSKVVNIVAN